MRVAVIGAGPAGCLIGGLLARQGHQVVLGERRRREDMRAKDARSIQLSLSPRGFRALAAAGLDERVRADSIALEGRVFHRLDGSLQSLLPIDPDWKNYSVSRWGLTETIIGWAQSQSGLDLRFGWQCLDIARSSQQVIWRSGDGVLREEAFDLVVGADGVASTVRSCIVRSPTIDFAKRFSPWGYAELTLRHPSDAYPFEPHGIHIWPRDNFFMVAFPAADRSYRATLVMRHAQVHDLLESGQLPGVLTQGLPDVVGCLEPGAFDQSSLKWQAIPIVRCGRWDDGQFLVMLGDAAHATAPFMGQGVNIALEDAARLAQELQQVDVQNLAGALARFSADRVMEGIACCDLSENAAQLLLKFPPPQADPNKGPLADLNFRGAHYAEVARAMLPGWQGEVYADAFPSLHSGVLPIDPTVLSVTHLPAGATLIESGSVADAMFVLQRGTVRIELATESLRLSAPTVIGEMGWFGSKRRTGSVFAETDCELGRLGYADLERLCRQSPASALPIVRQVSDLAVQRLTAHFHAGGGYLWIFSSPEAQQRLLRFARRFREDLAAMHPIADAALAKVLESEAGLRLSRQARSLGPAGPKTDAPPDAASEHPWLALVRTQQIRMVLLFGEASASAQDLIAQLRAAGVAVIEEQSSEHGTLDALSHAQRLGT